MRKEKNVWRGSHLGGRPALMLMPVNRTYDKSQYSSHCGLIDPISSNWQHYWHQSFSSSKSDPPRFLSTSVPLCQIRLQGMIQIVLLSASQLLMLKKNQHQHRTLSDESPGPGIAICVCLQCLRMRAYDAETCDDDSACSVVCLILPYALSCEKRREKMKKKLDLNVLQHKIQICFFCSAFCNQYSRESCATWSKMLKWII